MKKFSILLVLVFVLASCGKAIEEKTVDQASAPIDKIAEVVNVDETVVSEAKEAMLKEADVLVKDKTVGSKEEMVKNETVMTKEAGTYQDYSEAALQAAKGSNVLFFHATWCGSCVKADKALSTETLPEGLNVFKLDFDTSTELRKKYGVTTKHTFVLLDENMEKVKMDQGSIFNSADIQEKLLSGDEAMMKKDETAMEKETAVAVPVVAAGSYQDYSEAAVKSAKGNKVLFFAATWCPSCVSADKNMKAETIPEGLSTFKVDYDSNTDLRKKYGVTSQHTFVLVDDNMDKVKAMVGGRNSADIVNGLLN